MYWPNPKGKFANVEHEYWHKHDNVLDHHRDQDHDIHQDQYDSSKLLCQGGFVLNLFFEMLILIKTTSQNH